MSIIGLLAILGVCLSALAITWNILRDINDKGKLQSKVMIGRLYPDHTDKKYLVITITNIGRRPLLVQGWGGEEKKKAKGKKRYIYIIPYGLPRMLKEGESWVERTEDLSILSSNLKRICVWDSTGKYLNVRRKDMRRLIESKKKQDKQATDKEEEPDNAAEKKVEL